MNASVFVTGTDTGVGKTWVSSALIEALARSGLTVTGMKPVATGATHQGQLLVHEDVRALIAASNVALPRRYVNPYLYLPPCSPNIAAQRAGVPIELPTVLEAYQACAERADAVVVEGAGGWCVPLADNLLIEDLARALALPVLLVVGIRLGCISHAILSARAIIESGLPLLGWVANIVDPATLEIQAVIATLSRHLDAPRLATLEWAPGATPASVAPRLQAVLEALRRR